VWWHVVKICFRSTNTWVIWSFRTMKCIMPLVSYIITFRGQFMLCTLINKLFPWASVGNLIDSLKVCDIGSFTIKILFLSLFGVWSGFKVYGIRNWILLNKNIFLSLGVNPLWCSIPSEYLLVKRKKKESLFRFIIMKSISLEEKVMHLFLLCHYVELHIHLLAFCIYSCFLDDYLCIIVNILCGILHWF
jgi:hypothetical protein